MQNPLTSKSLKISQIFCQFLCFSCMTNPSSFSFAKITVSITDYEIVKILGVGSFGVVFLAKDKKNGGKEVALKVVETILSDNERKDQQNILNEVYVPSYLNLPGIVRLVGFRFPLTNEQKADKSLVLPKMKYTDIRGAPSATDFSGSIMVTELMPNGSLEKITKQYIKANGKSTILNPTIRTKILFGIAATMKRVHAMKVFHRDLKLENVFLDENFEPRIADFGLAKIVSDFITQTMSIGTPFYMAPELFIDGDEQYTNKVDVYAFGMLIYITFEDQIQLAVKKAVRSSEQYMMNIAKGIRPKKSDKIPELYWDLLCKCWAQDPEERPTFTEITSILRSDEYAIEEYGQQTDLNALHEYWDRIDPLTEEPKDPAPQLAYSTVSFCPGKSFKLKGTLKSSTPLKPARKTEFAWKRH